MLKYVLLLILGFIAGAVLIENKQYFSNQIPVPVAFFPDGGQYDGQLRKGELYDYGRIVWPDGRLYEGEFKDGLFHGRGLYKTATQEYEGDFTAGAATGIGKIKFADGREYEGEIDLGRAQGEGYMLRHDGEYHGGFQDNQFHGEGTWVAQDGSRYEGSFRAGDYHGEGVFITAEGEIYRGEFIEGELIGQGEYQSEDSNYKGGFNHWLFSGEGEFRSAHQHYSGEFRQGLFHGEGTYKTPNGLHYRGEFAQGRFHGSGVLETVDGERYEGGFVDGLKDGEGTLVFAKPLDGITGLTGVWQNGKLVQADTDIYELDQTRIVEHVLYNQAQQLQQVLDNISQQNPEKIDLYFVGVAGDGTQGVFRREVNFVQQLFDDYFLTTGRSVSLINSNVGFQQTPLATLTSIKTTLNHVAEKMNSEQDILFIFLTSHGSKDFQLQLAQPGLQLAHLSADTLGSWIRNLPVRHKVVVVSACYSGGYVQPIKDDHTMVIVAAAADRTSFGCSDTRSMTYFGEAFFKDTLTNSPSFADAFEKTREIVRGREAQHNYEYSNPLIFKPKGILTHLEKWRQQWIEDKKQQALLID